MKVKLRMTGKQHELLKGHLLAPDGKEAAALALCGESANRRVDLTEFVARMKACDVDPQEAFARFLQQS
jgi:hypothetical protein